MDFDKLDTNFAPNGAPALPHRNDSNINHGVDRSSADASFASAFDNFSSTGTASAAAPNAAFDAAFDDAFGTPTTSNPSQPTPSAGAQDDDSPDVKEVCLYYLPKFPNLLSAAGVLLWVFALGCHQGTREEWVQVGDQLFFV